MATATLRRVADGVVATARSMICRVCGKRIAATEPRIRVGLSSAHVACAAADPPKASDRPSPSLTAGSDHDRIVGLLEDHGSICFECLGLQLDRPPAILQAQVAGILGRSPDLLESGAGPCGMCRQEARTISHRRQM